MRTEAELEQLRADIAAQDRERQEAGQLRAEIERLTAENERLRAALQKVADLPLSDTPTHKRKTPARVRARRVAVGALKACQQLGVNPEEVK